MRKKIDLKYSNEKTVKKNYDYIMDIFAGKNNSKFTSGKRIIDELYNQRLENFLEFLEENDLYAQHQQGLLNNTSKEKTKKADNYYLKISSTTAYLFNNNKEIVHFLHRTQWYDKIEKLFSIFDIDKSQFNLKDSNFFFEINNENLQDLGIDVADKEGNVTMNLEEIEQNLKKLIQSWNRLCTIILKFFESNDLNMKEYNYLEKYNNKFINGEVEKGQYSPCFKEASELMRFAIKHIPHFYFEGEEIIFTAEENIIDATNEIVKNVWQLYAEIETVFYNTNMDEKGFNKNLRDDIISIRENNNISNWLLNNVSEEDSIDFLLQFAFDTYFQIWFEEKKKSFERYQLSSRFVEDWIKCWIR